MTTITTARVPSPRSPQRAAASPGAGRTEPARPSGPAAPVGRAPAPTSRSALSLLRQATAGLAEAHRQPEPLLRYPAAYLAALRAGAAVLAVRARPQPKRGASRNVWQLLAEVAPEFGEWAVFFASCSDTRAAAEAGIARLVGQREADDLLRQSEQFVRLVAASIPVR
jgi:SAV_6107-like HEPN